MAIIKCKMCGGDIEISADKTFGTCEYCGSTMTLPKTDDDQRLSLFNRGTHLRRNGEFDKAAAIYERLIGENDADAEAHWNLLLCRYGIEYVQDPASGERIPTCHRASFDSILNDVDYQAALKYSDGVARSLYEKEAQRIAALQKDILAISQKETPFDVFICYKESDENGKRTKDSALAQDIYYQLTDAGYKVFFARITLEDKLGQEYEPYIFAALHSAKVMVVVGTKPEYLNAVWVKNEWSRYLALMRTDRSRLLIPCYRDMDPYDMPEELSMLQSQDMGRIGFIQDLIRGVKKVVDAAKPQEAVTETVKETVVVHNEGGSNVQALLKRGNMALEDGEWGKADEFFEQVLNQDAECGAAYLGKFLASKKSKNAQDFVQSYLSTAEASAPTSKNAEACSEDSDFISSCIEKYVIDGYLPEKEIRQKLIFDRAYCADRSVFFQSAADSAKELLNRDRNFVRAEKYSSGDAKKQCDILRTGLVDALHQKSEESKQAENAEQAHITEAYRAFLHETEQRLAVRHKESLAQKQVADAEKQRRRMEQEKLEQEEAAKEAKRRKVRIIIGGVVAAAIAIVIIVTQIIVPSVNYSKAAGLQDAGNYDDALAVFTELGDYKDATKRKSYCEAELFLQAGDMTRAAISFGKSVGYQDARERSMALWDTIAARATLATGWSHTAALKANGTVVAVGNNEGGQCNVSDWSDIVALSVGEMHTVGLKAGGSVITAGSNKSGQCGVSDWTDIVAVSAGIIHTVGLKADGTVVAVGVNGSGICDVSDWTDIVAISARNSHTVGLKANGTVVAVGSNTDGRCDVSDWTDIVAISAGDDHTIGLKADGTVVAVGNNTDGQCDVSDWTDIVAISAGYGHTIGLRSDGTVVATGNNEDGQCSISDWANIVSISAGDHYTVGLKADSTVVAVGGNEYGQCDVSDWKDIKLPN